MTSGTKKVAVWKGTVAEKKDPGLTSETWLWQARFCAVESWKVLFFTYKKLKCTCINILYINPSDELNLVETEASQVLFNPWKYHWLLEYTRPIKFITIIILTVQGFLDHCMIWFGRSRWRGFKALGNTLVMGFCALSNRIYPRRVPINAFQRTSRRYIQLPVNAWEWPCPKNPPHSTAKFKNKKAASSVCSLPRSN